MHLPRSRESVPRLDFLSEIGSTNDELARRAASGAEPHFSVLATLDQTAGRGRLDRSWIAPAGTALAASTLIRVPELLPARLGWLSLAAGLAMSRAVADVLPAEARDSVEVKWPNDVLVGGSKISGVLAELVLTELLPDTVGAAPAVVVGAGVNLTMSAEQLPTSTATSLTLQGASDVELVDRVLSAYLTELRGLVERFLAAGMDARTSGLADGVRSACGSLGRRVRVELPDGTMIEGTATAVDDQGRLVIDGEHEIAAGDVIHSRFA